MKPYLMFSVLAFTSFPSLTMCGGKEGKSVTILVPTATVTPTLVPTRIVTPTPVDVTVAPVKKIQDYLVQEANLLLKQDKGLGYNSKEHGHTRDLWYAGVKFYTATVRTSHCVGFTYQILMQALNSWYKDTKNVKVWNMSLTSVKWEPFKHCWYVSSAISCYGAGDALANYGLGVKVKNFKDLQPGDFVNYDRTDGSGHSVMFLGFAGKGFKYVSSQGSTGGIAAKTAFFANECDSSVAARDCGLIRNSLVMGRVSEPTKFVVKNTFSLAGGTKEPEIDVSWANDENASKLK